MVRILAHLLYSRHVHLIQRKHYTPAAPPFIVQSLRWLPLAGLRGNGSMGRAKFVPFDNNGIH
jgi:hypothetical protein